MFKATNCCLIYKIENFYKNHNSKKYFLQRLYLSRRDCILKTCNPFPNLLYAQPFKKIHQIRSLPQFLAAACQEDLCLQYRWNLPG